MVVAVPSLAAQHVMPKVNGDVQVVRAILSNPDNQIDLVRTKLTLDRLIDPSIDVEVNVKRIDDMAVQVKSMLPPNASDLQTMEALIQYLYKPGAWNNNQFFQYDLSDPFGQNTDNKLLPTYLSTRKGNCVSMPVLFILLGQKLGLTVTASTTPQHVFVKYRLDGDIYRNFEATSGGPKLDSTYRRDMPMTDRALANGIYMQPLTKKETVAVMAEVLLQHYRQHDQQEQILAMSDLLLRYAPKDVVPMIYKGSAYGAIARRDFNGKYPMQSDIPKHMRPRYADLSRNNQLWFQKAEALGWQEPSAVTEAHYIKTIERIKTTQAN